MGVNRRVVEGISRSKYNQGRVRPMKTVKIAAVAALLTSSMLHTPALADSMPSATVPNFAMMDEYCQATYGGTDLRVKTTASNADVGGWDEVDGTRADIESTRVGDVASTITYGGTFSIKSGSEGRNGQSPNIFGIQQASTKTYSASFVDQSADFTRTTTYAFNCLVEERVAYEVPKENNGGGNDGDKDNYGHTGGPKTGDVPPGCEPSGGQPKKCDDEDGGTQIKYRWDEVASHDHDFTFTEGKKDLAEQGVASMLPKTYTGAFDVAQVVICNSPTKNPGTWRQQNGYTGVCSTTLFNSLGPVGIPSNSLPAS